MVEKGHMDVFTDHLLTVIPVPSKIKPGIILENFRDLHLF